MCAQGRDLRRPKPKCLGSNDEGRRGTTIISIMVAGGVCKSHVPNIWLRVRTSGDPSINVVGHRMLGSEASRRPWRGLAEAPCDGLKVLQGLAMAMWALGIYGFYLGLALKTKSAPHHLVLRRAAISSRNYWIGNGS